MNQVAIVSGRRSGKTRTNEEVIKSITEAHLEEQAQELAEKRLQETTVEWVAAHIHDELPEYQRHILDLIMKGKVSVSGR